MIAYMVQRAWLEQMSLNTLKNLNGAHDSKGSNGFNSIGLTKTFQTQ